MREKKFKNNHRVEKVQICGTVRAKCQNVGKNQ